MNGRWLGGGDRLAGDRAEGFDPIAEGRRYRLTIGVTLAIWERVQREVAAADEDGARRRFHELAALAAARGGMLGGVRDELSRLTRAADE